MKSKAPSLPRLPSELRETHRQHRRPPGRHRARTTVSAGIAVAEERGVFEQLQCRDGRMPAGLLDHLGTKGGPAKEKSNKSVSQSQNGLVGNPNGPNG